MKGFVPGEKIDFNIFYDNCSSRVELTKIKINLEQVTISINIFLIWFSNDPSRCWFSIRIERFDIINLITYGKVCEFWVAFLTYFWSNLPLISLYMWNFYQSAFFKKVQLDLSAPWRQRRWLNTKFISILIDKWLQNIFMFWNKRLNIF